MKLNTVKLGDICQIGDGAHASLKRQKEGIPYLTAKNITKNGIDYSTLDYISEETYLQHFKEKSNALTKPMKNDILYSIIGSIGGVYKVKNETVGISSSVAIFRCNEDIIPDYLYYFMKSDFFDAQIQSIRGGVAQGFMSLSKLALVEITYPPIKTQRRIASILSAYDNFIENNQKQIKLLEEAAQRLYKEWFVDLHFPGWENTKIVDGVPEGWEKAQLSDVIEKITTGLNPRKNFVLGHGNNYYVTIKNMGNNTIYLDDKCDRVDDAALEKINSRSDLKIGDILFSGIGTMGRVYLVSIPTNNWNVSESVFTIRANNRITKELLYLILLSSDMQKYCDNNAHGVAQRGIRMADLKAYPIILPSTSIIDSFTSVVKPIIEKTQSLNKQITKLAEARDRLLPKLMSGEIEV